MFRILILEMYLPMYIVMLLGLYDIHGVVCFSTSLEHQSLLFPRHEVLCILVVMSE